MQAITTKYLGPTNFRGSRVKAMCQAGSLILNWDDALDTNPNHDRAAIALRNKLGWDKDCYGRLYRGVLPDGTGNVYVFAADSERVG